MARVLVVDSDEDAANALAGVLECAGHRVRVADRGEGADDLARAVRAEIVLVARWLADIDGLKLLCRLKERPATTATPVVMLMGDAEHDASEAANACALGAADCMSGAGEAADAVAKVNRSLAGAAAAGRAWLSQVWDVRPVQEAFRASLAA